MKSSLFLRSLVLATALIGPVSRAADPQPAPAAPDIQALMALLNKIAAESAAEPADEPTPAAAPTPTPQSAPAAAHGPAPATRAPLSTALQTGTLRTGTLGTSSLATSSGPGGHGAGTVLRLTDEVWRQLFPSKPNGN